MQLCLSARIKGVICGGNDPSARVNSTLFRLRWKSIDAACKRAELAVRPVKPIFRPGLLCPLSVVAGGRPNRRPDRSAFGQFVVLCKRCRARFRPGIFRRRRHHGVLAPRVARLPGIGLLALRPIAARRADRQPDVFDSDFLYFTEPRQRHLRRRIVGRLTVAILTIYPNQIGYVPVLATETFYTALLLAALVIVVRGGHSVARLALAGLVFGIATLTKAQTLFSRLFCLRHGGSPPPADCACSRAIAKAAVVYAAMALVIVPWTVRNYLVFGEFVLISTNGGGTLLSGNNPTAWGDYTEDDPLVRQVPNDVAGQVANDRLARSLALQWIEEQSACLCHPRPEEGLAVVGPRWRGGMVPIKPGSMTTNDIGCSSGSCVA